MSPSCRATARSSAARRATHAYMVSKDGAARLVRELSTLRDALIARWRNCARCGLGLLCRVPGAGAARRLAALGPRPAAAGLALLVRHLRRAHPAAARPTPSPATTPRASRPRKERRRGRVRANSPRMTAPRPSRRRPSPRWRPWSPSPTLRAAHRRRRRRRDHHGLAANYVICSCSRSPAAASRLPVSHSGAPSRGGGSKPRYRHSAAWLAFCSK